LSAVSTLVGERYSCSLALEARSPLREFNEAGVLSAADVHVAALLGRLSGVTDPEVLLAAALAVRAPRLGHVFVDLELIARTAVVESGEGLDPASLRWPEPGAWVMRMTEAEALVALGEPSGGADVAAHPARPLRLLGTHLYLDRHWREERQVARDLQTLAGSAMRRVDVPLLASGIDRLFVGHDDPDQRVAVASAILRPFAVVSGGPGTGKTTTVAKVLALLLEQALAVGARAPLVAMCAPTGKAAARLEESVRSEAAELDLADDLRAALSTLQASTIHRLLGWPLTGHGRLRHDRANRLPHDVVVVDETSMVSLTLMARLLAAVRQDASLLLVGDVDQLTAVEVGAVLRDIVGPAARRPRMTPGTRAAVALAAGVEPDVEPAAPLAPAASGPAASGTGHETGAAASSPPFGDGIVVLRGVHRFGAGIARLAAAVRLGDQDAVLEALTASPGSIEWLAPEQGLGPLRDAAVAAALETVRAARHGDAAAALARLGAFRLLCAHRHGASGVSTWSATMQRWLAEAIPRIDPGAGSYAGQPLLITRNDYELRLYNGDLGVVVESPPGVLGAVFERDGRLVSFAPSRLESALTAHAITIHRSQGSQFDLAAVVLGDPGSRILTRELLYTAVTRARRRLILIASESAVRTAVARPVARATGLRERLWGGALGGV
jgi:exodeoxyribonuclease V alpha subunit